MKIVVLGASGFIGNALVNVLRSRPGVDVVAAVRRNSRLQVDIPIFDTTVESLSLALGDARPAMIVDAAYDARSAGGNRHLIDSVIAAARRHGNCGIVYLSSTAVLARGGPVSLGESDPHPISYYGRIKRMDELRLASAGVAATILRLPNIVGGGSSWDKYFDRIMKARTVALPLAGQNNGIFVTRDDVVNWIANVTKKPLWRNYESHPLYQYCPSGYLRQWREVIKQFNPSCTIRTTNNRTYSDDRIRNVIFTIVSSKLVSKAWYLFGRPGKPRSLHSGASFSSSAAHIMSENTTRVAQATDFSL